MSQPNIKVVTVSLPPYALQWAERYVQRTRYPSIEFMRFMLVVMVVIK